MCFTTNLVISIPQIEQKIVNRIPGRLDRRFFAMNHMPIHLPGGSFNFQGAFKEGNGHGGVQDDAKIPGQTGEIVGLQALAPVYPGQG